MASSSNRKSNSSASRAAKPTFRKATAAQKRPVSKSAPASRPASVPAPKKPISAYTAPSRKTSSRVAASVKAKRPATGLWKGPAPWASKRSGKPRRRSRVWQGHQESRYAQGRRANSQSIYKGRAPRNGARASNTRLPRQRLPEPRPRWQEIASGAKAIASKLPVPPCSASGHRRRFAGACWRWRSPPSHLEPGLVRRYRDQDGATSM